MAGKFPKILDAQLHTQLWENVAKNLACRWDEACSIIILEIRAYLLIDWLVKGWRPPGFHADLQRFSASSQPDCWSVGIPQPRLGTLQGLQRGPEDRVSRGTTHHLHAVHGRALGGIQPSLHIRYYHVPNRRHDSKNRKPLFHVVLKHNARYRCLYFYSGPRC